MAYVGGQLNYKVRLKDYHGVTSQTAEVKIDDNTSAIEVNVLALPAHLKALPAVDSRSNGMEMQVKDGKWKMVPAGATVPKPTENDTEKLLVVSNNATPVWKTIETNAVINVESLPENAKSTIIYRLKGESNKYFFYDKEWFEVANQADLENAIEELNSKINTIDSAITIHTSEKNNPHSVTKSQIGLGKVDNTSDLDKPISNLALSKFEIIENKIQSLKSELADLEQMLEENKEEDDIHESDFNNPHKVTAQQVGISANLDGTQQEVKLNNLKIGDVIYKVENESHESIKSYSGTFTYTYPEDRYFRYMLSTANDPTDIVIITPAKPEDEELFEDFEFYAEYNPYFKKFEVTGWYYGDVPEEEQVAVEVKYTILKLEPYADPGTCERIEGEPS